MSSKIITLRLPRSTYDALSSAAAVAGLPLSVYVRGKIDRAELAAILDSLRAEVQSVAAAHHSSPIPPSREREILLLVRTMAAHLNPQIPSAVAKRLKDEAQAKSNLGAQT
jgi:hypothetical protein